MSGDEAAEAVAPDRQSECKDRIFEHLTSIVRAVLRRPALELLRTTVIADVAGWNSFMTIDIVVEIERSFAVSFENRDLDNLHTLGDWISRVDEKLAAARG